LSLPRPGDTRGVESLVGATIIEADPEAAEGRAKAAAALVASAYTKNPRRTERVRRGFRGF
jgi:hypothetical protein